GVTTLFFNNHVLDLVISFNTVHESSLHLVGGRKHVQPVPVGVRTSDHTGLIKVESSCVGCATTAWIEVSSLHIPRILVMDREVTVNGVDHLSSVGARTGVTTLVNLLDWVDRREYRHGENSN